MHRLRSEDPHQCKRISFLDNSDSGGHDREHCEAQLVGDHAGRRGEGGYSQKGAIDI